MDCTCQRVFVPRTLLVVPSPMFCIALSTLSALYELLAVKYMRAIALLLVATGRKLFIRHC